MAVIKLRFPRIRKRTYLYVIAATLFILGCMLAMHKISSDERKTEQEFKFKVFEEVAEKVEKKREEKEKLASTVPEGETQVKVEIGEGIAVPKHGNNIVNKLENLDQGIKTTGIPKEDNIPVRVAIPPRPNYNAHIFYYAWYGNPKTNGKYLHWNHQYLPHWVPEVDKQYRHGRHNPPDNIGANFYPALGPYSSKDPHVIHDHMKQMCAAGVGVIALSWYPPNKANDQGGYSDTTVPLILEIAHMYDMKVTLHIEPYEGRDDKTLHEDVKYIVDTYSKHRAFYMYKHKDGRSLPFLYVYDSYRTPASKWANLLKPEGSHSVRNTPYDCVFISLMVESTHRDAINVGGFDGFYTYFATDGFTYGSAWRTWPHLAKFAKQTNTLFIPSVGPGYIDTSIRPWNSKNTRPRQNGEYYRKSWTAALSVHPEIVTITSFNEWHEGTQIEKAVPKSVPGLMYKSYSPNEPDFYLKMTKEFVGKMGNSS